MTPRVVFELVVEMTFVSEKTVTDREHARCLTRENAGAHSIIHGQSPSGRFGAIGHTVGAVGLCFPAATAIAITVAMMGCQPGATATRPSPNAPSVESRLKAPATVEWMKDESAAVAAARKQGKPIVINFWAAWCVPCKMLNEKTLADRMVQGRIGANYIALDLDVTMNSDADEVLQAKYDAKTLPAILLVTADGEELGRVTKFVKASVLVELLDAATRKMSTLQAEERPPTAVLFSRKRAERERLAKEHARAQALYARQSYSTALEMAEDALKTDPGYVPMRILAVQIHCIFGDPKPATLHFKRVPEDKKAKLRKHCENYATSVGP